MNKNRNVFKDTQNAKFGDVYATICGRLLHLMNVKNVKATSNVKTQEIPVLGNMIVGRKPTGMELKIVMTVYKVSETFDGSAGDQRARRVFIDRIEYKDLSGLRDRRRGAARDA